MSSQTQAAPEGPRLLEMYRMMVLIREFEEQVRSAYPVSYTHLTLPTILRV